LIHGVLEYLMLFYSCCFQGHKYYIRGSWKVYCRGQSNYRFEYAIPARSIW
jgi:hypothetical protein